MTIKQWVSLVQSNAFIEDLAVDCFSSQTTEIIQRSRNANKAANDLKLEAVITWGDYTWLSDDFDFTSRVGTSIIIGSVLCQLFEDKMIC